MARGLASSRHVTRGRRFGENAVLIRELPGSRVEGEWVRGEVEEKKVRLASAPLSTQSMMTIREMLPEGPRLQQMRQFWFATPDNNVVRPIRVAPNMQTDGDVIRYRGVDYKIVYLMGDYSEEGFVDVIGARPD